jgi:hypothetical protein
MNFIVRIKYQRKYIVILTQNDSSQLVITIALCYTSAVSQTEWLSGRSISPRAEVEVIQADVCATAVDGAKFCTSKPGCPTEGVPAATFVRFSFDF